MDINLNTTPDPDAVSGYACNLPQPRVSVRLTFLPLQTCLATFKWPVPMLNGPTVATERDRGPPLISARIDDRFCS